MSTAAMSSSSSSLFHTSTSTISTAPKINITNPTPPRPTISNNVTASTSPSTSTTPSKPPVGHRLLYRGSLSLPDSYLLLDGLTFVASGPVLQNTTALALESMRGRPCLRFTGIVKLKDLWMDTGGGVCMDIHPDATLSRVYFENIFCLLPIISQDGRSETGVRVALGDNDGPETTQIVIYAQTSPSSRTLTLQIARITTTPPTLLRPPRPDDPTPRKPPPHFTFTTDARKGKRKATDEDERVRKAREVMLFGRISKSKEKEPVFKVPSVPTRGDVFGPLCSGSGVDNGNGKGKGKAQDKERAEADKEREKAEAEMEQSNKSVLKKLAMRLLASAGADKTDAGFKELFGFVYRGAAFALRSSMKVKKLDMQIAERAVEAHVRLYHPSGNGNGG
ncbi:hypothetical protein PLICRDRAFT_25981 [Plicaturopsis crispa FD-325 SS-3]|nr:hypothetical protein PLICRDRAFT_25981 [Plicaturopsis crispa FD-325 SS-3]